MSKVPPKITYVTLLADKSIHPRYEAAVKQFSRKLGRHYHMYIGDQEALSEEGEFEVRSPLDTSIITGYFQRGNRRHAKRAIAEGKRAFTIWSKTPWQKRVRIMRRASKLIDQRKFEIAAAITYEAGKNRLEALAEAWEAIDAIRYYALIMEQNEGYVKKMEAGPPGENSRLVAKPLGVWPVISPFNFPFMLANGMALGALIAGNTVVLKPTSASPLTGLLLYRVYRDAGVPSGAVNYVTGPGSNFENEFTSNPDVAGIAFTGSKDVGMKLYHDFLEKQPYPKPMVLEMGSKNPTLVTSKADLKKAVEGAVRAAFGYCGQKCSATSRIYLQRSISREFIKAFKERIRRLPIGDPRQRGVFMGPVINKAAVEKFKRAVKDVKRSRGKILYGGHVLRKGNLARGYYVEPTMVSGLPADHKIFKEELFVPLLAVDEFNTLGEALRKANDTNYGLTAGIFSEDRREIQKFLDEIEFGVVYANRRGGATTGAWPGAQTFVGWRASGATGRGIGGPHYLLNFLREQSQTVVSE